MKKYILIFVLAACSAIAQDIEPGPLHIDTLGLDYIISKDHPNYSLDDTTFILGWHWGAKTTWSKAMETKTNCA